MSMLEARLGEATPGAPAAAADEQAGRATLSLTLPLPLTLSLTLT